MRGGFGQNSDVPYVFYDQGSSSWSMYQGCLFSDLRRFSETWPKAALMRNGVVFRRRNLERRMKGKECLLQPGTLVMVWDRSVSCQQEPFIGEVIYHNGDMVDVIAPDGDADCFPVEWIMRVPSPGASDYRSGKGYNHGGKLQTPQLRHVMRGAINPPWIEWLMGFPIGWTESGPSETPSSPKSPNGSDAD